MDFTIFVWHPIASIVTVAPFISIESMTSGSIVISDSFFSPIICRRTVWCSVTNAFRQWMASRPFILSCEPLTVFPSRAIIFPFKSGQCESAILLSRLIRYLLSILLITLRKVHTEGTPFLSVRNFFNSTSLASQIS